MDHDVTRMFQVKVFNLKQVEQTAALPAERLDVSFQQQLIEKDLEKENIHSDSEEKHPAAGIVKHWYS